MFQKKSLLLSFFFLIVLQTLMLEGRSSAQAKKTDQTPSKVLASDALRLLKEGNALFSAKAFSKRLAAYQKNNPHAPAQNPHSIILSCSDSRVPPGMIFDQGLGETFSVRDAGEVPGISGHRKH